MLSLLFLYSIHQTLSISKKKMVLLIHSFQDIIEQLEFQPQEGETVGECLQRFFEEMDIQQDLLFQPKIDQVVVVDYKKPTKRINTEMQMSDLIKQNPDYQLMVVYPSEPKGALIEFKVNEEECYFQNLVNKSQAIGKYVNALLSKIGIKNEVQIKINGKLSTNESELQMKPIKKLIALGNSDKIMIEINDKMKQKNKLSNGKKKEENKKKIEMEDSKKAVKYENKKVNGQKKDKENQIVQQKSNKIKDENNKKIEEEPFKFSISFQTLTGQRSLSIPVSPQETMNEALPKILQNMIEAGFDWDLQLKDYRDKLSIAYKNTEFNKFDKKFKSILTSEVRGQHFQFVIKRHYSGG